MQEDMPQMMALPQGEIPSMPDLTGR